MPPKALMWIGILTLLIATFGLEMLYSTIAHGLWTDFSDMFLLLGGYVYFTMIMPATALIIGVATLRNKKWAWKANVVFQSVSITIVTSTLAVPYILDPSRYDFILLNRPLVVLLGCMVLFLLLRPKTRAYYKPVASAP